MNCFIRRIAAAPAEEEEAARKVAESRSEMGTDMIGNGKGCQEIKQIFHCTFSLAMKTEMCHLIIGRSTTQTSNFTSYHAWQRKQQLARQQMK